MKNVRNPDSMLVAPRNEIYLFVLIKQKRDVLFKYPPLGLVQADPNPLENQLDVVRCNLSVQFHVKPYVLSATIKTAKSAWVTPDSLTAWPIETGRIRLSLSLPSVLRPFTLA